MSAAVVLALSLVLADEPPPPSMFVDETPAPFQVSEMYFRTKNLTILEVNLSLLRLDESGRLQLDVDEVYTGKGRTGADKRNVMLHFLASGYIQIPRYKENHSIVLRADGEAAQLEADRYESNDESGLVKERIDVRLASKEPLRRLWLRPNGRGLGRPRHVPTQTGTARRDQGVRPVCAGPPAAGEVPRP